MVGLIMKKIELMGRKFGRLTVVELSDRIGRRSWVCACECGNKIIVTAGHLSSGHSRSCGCLSKDVKPATTHGMSGTREYYTWGGMIQRCTNPDYHNYHFYGGRGITVCDEWRNSFEVFYKDMGPRPKNTSLDRVKNGLGYSKDNCRWATPAEQCANRREKHTSPIFTVEGFTGTAANIARHFNIPHCTLSMRMKKSKCDAAYAIKYIRAFRKINGVHGKKKLPADWLVVGG